MEKRAITNPSRYSPYPTTRSSERSARSHAITPIPSSSKDALDKDDPSANSVEVGQTFVVDEGVSPREIGAFVSGMGVSTNLELLEALPDLTNDVPSLDTIDVMTTDMNASEMRNTIVGLCVVVNRLLQDNRFLLRELAAIKSGTYSSSITRMERYEFKKRAIRSCYLFAGTDDIPRINLSEIAAKFDVSTPQRRNENCLHTIRRFVRFVLENTIPADLHTKFTLRERGGQDYLTELSPDLLSLIRDMCLEALNLLDSRSDEDRIRRDDFVEYINRTAKAALQEMRRNPRKTRSIQKSSAS